MTTKIEKLIGSCKECTHRMYSSGGVYKCTLTQSELNNSIALPNWCPLPDSPYKLLSSTEKELLESKSHISHLNIQLHNKDQIINELQDKVNKLEKFNG